MRWVADLPGEVDRGDVRALWDEHDVVGGGWIGTEQCACWCGVE
jgi:hypothetical protein